MGFESRRSGFDLGRPGRETFAALYSILPSNGKVIRGACDCLKESLHHSHSCLTAEKGADANAQGGEMVTLYRPHPLNATRRLNTIWKNLWCSNLPINVPCLLKGVQN
jgi:hypothetical protein